MTLFNKADVDFALHGLTQLSNKLWHLAVAMETFFKDRCHEHL